MRIIPGNQYRMRCGVPTSDLEQSDTEFVLSGSFIPHGRAGFEIVVCGWHVSGVYCGGGCKPLTPGLAHEYDIIAKYDE